MKKDISSAYHVMWELWERNSHTFTKNELEWFAGAVDQAEIITGSLQDAISSIEYLLSNPGIAGENHDMPGLLWAISNQLDAIRGLLHVGTSAEYRLRHPELFEKKDSMKPNVEQLPKKQNSA